MTNHDSQQLRIAELEQALEAERAAHQIAASQLEIQRAAWAREYEAHEETKRQLAEVQRRIEAFPEVREMRDQRDAALARVAELEQALVLIGEKAVVDWDDSTVGAVDAIVKPQTYNDWVRVVMIAAKEHDQALREKAEAEAHNAELENKLAFENSDYQRMNAQRQEFLIRAMDAEQRLAASELARAQMREALLSILAEPYGCPKCDSGKLRPSIQESDHWPDCPYRAAREALASPSPKKD